jgi:hypothetical protein
MSALAPLATKILPRRDWSLSATNDQTAPQQIKRYSITLSAVARSV